MIKTLQFIAEEISCKYNINFSEAQKIIDNEVANILR